LRFQAVFAIIAATNTGAISALSNNNLLINNLSINDLSINKREAK
jgi:hypothetical protein